MSAHLKDKCVHSPMTASGKPHSSMLANDQCPDRAVSVGKRLTIRVASMPNADKFSLHIYAALAEQERDFISLRTKQSLAVAKSRGVKLGGMRDATMKRNKVAIAAANAAAERVSSIIKPMRSSGSTLQQIADALNTAKVPTPRNRQWQAMSVKNALARLEA